MERLKAGLVLLRSKLAAISRQAPVVAQSMVEYAIIAAVVAVFAIAAVNGLGKQLVTAFNNIGSTVVGAPSNNNAGGPP
ncbi:MAG: Flp family type IVb pilin [Chloroflexi bacterium]|nr:Flp family type IVb pilin [Chloroflexota bacterium]MBV9543222.1 Flp family type IVb pilin [Chloroflexota bacterium]